MEHLIQIVDCLPEHKLQRAMGRINERPDMFGESPLYKRDKGTHTDLSVRSNTTYAVDDNDELAKLLHHAMMRGLAEYKRRLVEINFMYDQWPMINATNCDMTREEIQILKYNQNQHYTWHTDQFANRRNQLHNRCLSVVLYLTGKFNGGRTCFPHKCYKPKPGQALIFPSSWAFPHKAETVTSGTKIVAVAWYHSRCYD